MSENNSGPINAVKGVIEGAIGIVKQLLGIFFSRGDLQEEGEAQQDKAAAQRKVAKKEAEAEKARGEAKVQAIRQKGAK
jgi:hypothetical protein